jgi:ATP-binding cassette, subfamily B, bacterial HlyB/CyaB
MNTLQSFYWLIGSLCVLHRRPFSPELLEREFPVPHDISSYVGAARAFGLSVTASPLKNIVPPTMLLSNGMVGVITAVGKDGQHTVYWQGQDQSQQVSAEVLLGHPNVEFWNTAVAQEQPSDPDAHASQQAGNTFGFKWFVPELLRHKRVWRDVLIGSAALQLVALATPLFTQAIIDKVVVHRTQSTLITIGIAMLVFTLFTGLLSWVRQYLVLHTGNRIDAVLGASVWERLLQLPIRYFEHRPTGVIAARLHGVETIREFLSSAAISLILDLPFLIICLAVMLYYSVILSAIVVAVLLVIAIASALMAPVFQKRLNEQFLLGARNQAFVTEHVAGLETVKSLQMEPQLKKRYGQYLASFLESGFKTKQIANSYNVFATTAEQLMTIAILLVGAWVVMTEPAFTIGMLVAFQMFAGKLSQPVLRIVGLWTQFQQASLAVQRLGDLMNAPMEPYSLVPQRQADGKGRIQIEGLAFQYQPDLPVLFADLNLTVEPGQAVAIMGPSGSGKSTLAKLLMGFYMPSQGQLRIDGVDTRNLNANELRSYFGVVPQETILFSGTILENLHAGRPSATLEQVVVACKLAGIHSVIEALPKGYQTEIGERGTGLSGGQKQRIAIARALLKQPKVLIFDEATSALDKDTAESFAATVNQLKGKVTMLFITHGMPKNLRIDAVLQMNKSGGHEFRLVEKSPKREH